MRILHISASYFNDSSFIGGGERYLTELASSMAELADTTIASFGPRDKTYQLGRLKFRIYKAKRFIKGNRINPLNFRHLSSVTKADCIHIHHLYTFVSDLASVFAFFLRKPVFVTDYGGGCGMVLSRFFPVFNCYTKGIAFSDFGLRQLPPEIKNKAVVFKGGIDTQRFSDSPGAIKENKILFVGRILPHKGINYLIEAFRLLNRKDYKLAILGRVYDEKFYRDLKILAEGLAVDFIHEADDRRLLLEYRTSKVTVLPSVNRDLYGNYAAAPELMGFVLLESQACGTPVIATDAGAMPEFIDNNKTGFIVRQNSAEEICAALNRIIDLEKTEYAKFSLDSRKWVEPFAWGGIVEKHLELYKKCAS